MPFAAFMSLALYHPQHGYYTAGPQRVGWDGHFLTSPELDPAFGELWASAFQEVWTGAGRPPAFDVVEIGPGEGAFAESVLRSVSGAFADALTYRLVERSPALRERQEQRLEGAERVVWSPSITEVPTVEHGCVFANEVLDNLPVHLVQRRGDSLREICVGAGQSGLEFVELAPSNPELERYLARCGVELPEGHRYEIGLAAESFVNRTAAMFEKGCVVLVDYGDDAAGLARRPLGSLVAYSAAGTDERVLDGPGTKDITAHSNWTAVSRACRAAGLEASGPLSQRDVLVALGLHSFHARLRDEYAAAIAEGEGAQAINALSRRQAIGALADAGGLGGLQVLIATKGIDAPDFIRGKEKGAG